MAGRADPGRDATRDGGRAVSYAIERLNRVIEAAGLDYVDIARMLETNPRTVSRWINEGSEPRWDVRERLLELTAVIERLTQVVQPRAAQDWLFTPNSELGYDKPVELVRQGRFKDVLALIDSLGEGVFI